MAITKISNSSLSNLNKYDSFLAGNAAYIPLPVVTGGTLYSDATYYYRVFAGNGTLGVTNLSITADILAIGGGGSGGNSYTGGGYGGGGGGAGGLVYSASQTVPAGASWPIVIGGSNSNSTVNTSSYVASAGGLGAGADSGHPTGYNGGCGGGAYAYQYIGYTGGTGSQGANGGNSYGQGGRYAQANGGGGGGATTAGGNAATSYTIGKGGNGSSAYSSWGAVTGYGQNISGTYWFAGGGSGAGNSGSGEQANGGNGGGAGYSQVNGTANTGGGGYAQYGSTSSGGSGIVIVRYTRSQVGG